MSARPPVPVQRRGGPAGARLLRRIIGFVADGAGGVGDVPAEPIVLDRTRRLAPEGPVVSVADGGPEAEQSVAGRVLLCRPDAEVADIG
ncbi:MAG: hypothetical protein ABR592_07855 [Nitriliruptorales bacterium]